MDDEQSARERDLDETLEETFPASDPPANTVETGVGTAPPARDPERVAPQMSVVDNRTAHRFELVVDGQTAVLVYDRTPDSLVLVHTEVPEALRGRHIADILAKAALDAADAEGLRAVVVCPFVKAYLRRHPRP